MVEFLGGDGAVGEKEVAGGEAGKGPPAQVHDDLDEAAELRMGLRPPPHLQREEDQKTAQLLIEPVVLVGDVVAGGGRGKTARPARRRREKGQRRGEATGRKPEGEE